MSATRFLSDSNPHSGGRLATYKWSCAMKARALIDEAPFGPETVKAIGKAFDQACARINKIFDEDPNGAEVARIRLAKAILSGATDGNTDVEDLKNRAIVELAKTTGPRLMRE
jgi:regulator of protease activity HflC (stomatin/prohibitin superfamily)